MVQRYFGSGIGRWVAACLIGVVTLGLFYADPSGRVVLVVLLMMMAGHVLLNSRVQGGRALVGVVINFVATGLTVVVLTLTAMYHPTSLWVAPLYGAVLAFATTFVVGERRDARRRIGWGRYIGYALAALVSAAIGSNLFDHPGEFVFPFGALTLILYCAPGAAIGGGMEWLLQMILE